MKRLLLALALAVALLAGCGQSPEDQAQEIVTCMLEAGRVAEECMSMMEKAPDEVNNLVLEMLVEELGLMAEDFLNRMSGAFQVTTPTP